ncbi:MAG TPA: hypothetical protein VFW98_11670 [Gemmatimonadaceae bacterium]|nr:hypothetical protein [Gemmatimonadaceae bacterium]
MHSAEVELSVRLEQLPGRRPERAHGATPSRAEAGGLATRASVLDTCVLLLAIGTVIVTCGVVTTIALHPVTWTALAERLLAILALG